jgi:hypothetical protein
MSRDFPAADGRWLRFQANYPHLRAAALNVLGTSEDGAVIAASRTTREWAAHPRGAAVAAEPLAAITETDHREVGGRPVPERPLAEAVLSRIFAYPVTTFPTFTYSAARQIAT